MALVVEAARGGVDVHPEIFPVLSFQLRSHLTRRLPYEI